MTTITTLNGLQDMDLDLAGNYELGNDIDASGTAAWNGGLGFEPIGDNATPFTGTFDGKGFTITGLTINRPATDYIGLFGYTAGAVDAHVAIKNVTLAAAAITGDDWVGALVGKAMAYTDISSCVTSGTVVGDNTVGGLVGSAYDADPTLVRIDDCSSSCTVTASGIDGGGLIGNYTATVSYSYATGSVTALNYASGFGNPVNSAVTSHCFATGTVVATNNYAGGFCGYLGGSVADCYATGSVTGDASHDGSSTGIGGFAGQTDTAMAVTRCYSTGAVAGTSVVGGFVGDDGGAVFTGCAWDEDTSGTATACGSGAVTGITGYTTAEMKDGTATDGWSPVDWDLITASNNGYACLLGITPGCLSPDTPNVIGDRTVVVEKPVLELIRNVEVQLDGRFYVDKNGNAVYESRFHRSG
jgi:hypothetical protein